MYIAQQRFSLSDESIEDVVDSSQSIRHFIRIDLNVDTAPDANYVVKILPLAKKHSRTEVAFDSISGYLAARGALLIGGHHQGNNYMLNQWQAPMYSCKDGTAEIDNNIAQNALWGCFPGRKTSYFYKLMRRTTEFNSATSLSCTRAECSNGIARTLRIRSCSALNSANQSSSKLLASAEVTSGLFRICW
jgi:hypothetical protein